MFQLKHLFILSLVLIFAACTKQSAGDDQPAGPSVSDEMAECTTSTSYSPSVSVTGTAQFYKRGLTVTENGANTVTRLILGSPISTALPIRFAEVRVLNSSGSVVQCGKTNSTGQLKALDGTSTLSIPNTAGTYTIQVLARVNHSMAVPVSKPAFYAYASVKSDIYSNSVYKITSTISSSGSGSYSATLTATASESTSTAIEGGAFNIYNDLISTYEYLADNTSTVDISCLNPKLDIYWKAGFNPAQYIYPEEDPSQLGTLSFYLRGENELYINGGVLDDVATSDTDHFDDAVIIHEIGHHIEDVCGTMDSPGGTHYGRFRIDPRLAWSEGFGNFMGAHIVRNKLSTINPDLPSALTHGWFFYYDSQGYGSNGYEYIRINLARSGSSTTESIYSSSGTMNVTYDAVNPSTYAGESHFREVSVARGLFKGTNTCSGLISNNCVNADHFAEYWQALENRSGGIGMGKSIYPFRSSVRFIDRLRVAQGGTLSSAINTMLTTDEALQPVGNSSYVESGYTVWVPYAVNLVPSGSPCNLKIQPRQNSVAANGDSDQRYSNHFYTIDKTLLPSVTSIRLNASNVAGTSGLSIDGLIFQQDYNFNQDCSAYDSNGNCTTAAQTTTSDVVVSARSGSYPRSMSISGLSSSLKYMLNIRAYTPSTVAGTTEYSYTLTDQSGGYLCPSGTY